jgi:hypothetical protein
MKKVVRLTENDLNRLVRRIISEAPFDAQDEPFDFDSFNKDSEKYEQDRFKKIDDRKAKYDEFIKNGIPIKEDDVNSLLKMSYYFCKGYEKDNPGENKGPYGTRWEASVATEYKKNCHKLKDITAYVDDMHSQNFSKRF